MRWRESDCRAALLIRNNHCCDQLDQLGLPVGARCSALEPFPFRLNRNGGSLSCLDALSSREPVSTPDHGEMIRSSEPPSETGDFKRVLTKPPDARVTRQD